MLSEAGVSRNLGHPDAVAVGYAAGPERALARP